VSNTFTERQTVTRHARIGLGGAAARGVPRHGRALPQLGAQMVEVLHAVTLAEMPSDQVAAVAKLEKPEQRSGAK
jgi:hypothetical protein